ncbi:unnamed protein product [Camellia sinensis]
MGFPAPIFRGLIYPIPTIYTVSRPLWVSLCSCSSFCAALNIIREPKQLSTDSALDDFENPQFQLHIGFEEIPTRSSSTPDWPERNARNRMERLKGYSEKLGECALKASLNEGKAIHGQVIKNGIDPDMHLWVSLINFYAKCHVFNFARQVLDEMPERDVVSWTALISGLVADGYGNDCIPLFSEMRNEGIRPNEFSLATCLKAGSICLDLQFGKQVHAEVIKLGFFSDIYVGSALVDLYAKCGEMECADKVFFCLPKQNDVSWNALLNGYAQMGDEENVLKMFCGMMKSKMKFSKFTLSTALKGFANSGNLGAGRVVHSMAIKIGCELDEFVSCTLVDMYSKCELADDALKVFMRIKNPHKVAWAAMIACFDQQGQKLEAAKLFHLMRKTGLRPNQFTLASIVRTAIDFTPHYGESIHACVYKYGFEYEILLRNALITMYMKIGSVDDGFRVFDTMTDRDVVSWNALLSGFHDNESFDQGPKIFNQMLVEGFKPDIYTFISILRCCSSLWNASFGKQVHAHIIKESLNGHSHVGTALISMYTNSGCLEDAGVIFNRLHKKDLLTWTVICSGYAQNDEGDKVVNCFNQMRQEGLKPNEFTLSSCLGGCSNLATLETGKQFHSLALKVGVSGGTYVASALVDMYVKCRSIEDAETIFKDMIERNPVSWNTIICGYSQHGKGEKALQAFQLMLDEGCVPDEVTFIGILSACSHKGLVEEGKKHFDSLNKVYGITPAIEHHACMVNILSRAGKFHEVENFIEEMKLTRNTLIWETVLWASKLHGNVEFGQKAAEKLFELEPEMDYNYILLSDIFATKGRWDDVAKVRALMSNRGIKKEPGCSWVKIDSQAHIFFAQDGSDPKIKEICLQMGGNEIAVILKTQPLSSLLVIGCNQNNSGTLRMIKYKVVPPITDSPTVGNWDQPSRTETQGDDEWQ